MRSMRPRKINSSARPALPVDIELSDRLQIKQAVAFFAVFVKIAIFVHYILTTRKV